MQILKEIRQIEEPTALTVGFFDGVHLGHRAIIEKAKQKATHTVVVTFENHPVTVLRPTISIPLICTLDHRLKLFEELGVDTVLLLKFTKELSEKTAEQFISELREAFSLSWLVLGYDAVLGKGREGQKSVIEALGKKMHFGVEYVPEVKIEGAHLSSSVIRKAVNENDLVLAEKLLGRRFSYYGQFLGGCMDLTSLIRPPKGEYNVSVKGQKKRAMITGDTIEVKGLEDGLCEVEFLVK